METRTDLELVEAAFGGDVEGFETTDPAAVGGMMEDVKVTLWVDEKTWLPVREELYFKMGEQMQTEGVLEDFVWNLQVDASEFEPAITQDYKDLMPGGYKVPSFNEETAIEGLRFFSDNKGRYPEKLNIMTITKEVTTAATFSYLKQKDANNPSKEVMQKIQDTMRPVQALVGFYIMQVAAKKEPAYYGDVVGPADADKVLMRWKVSDTEYRVIYGDLKAETVSAERLAELEGQLPK